VSERDVRPVTPAAGLAMARVQLLAMVGMGCHYTALGSAGGQYPSTCRAAIITQALDIDSGDVGLCILNPEGMYFQPMVRYDPAGAPGTWHWPETA
jgi:hypothetical protein